MFDPDLLVNRYYVMRHGLSEANRHGLIVSRPDNGIGGFGLTDEGCEQVEASLRLLLASKHGLDNQTRIISSDFLRAVETAAIVRERLRVARDMTLDARLRERDFGELELLSNLRYEDVWAGDEHDSMNAAFGAEPVDAVLARTLALVNELENSDSGATFLLVSHGDTLQILMTAFMGRKATGHRQLDHLETAEIRCLNPMV